MNWEIFGALGEWAGAIAVVVTLIYLSRQLGLTRKQAMEEITRDVDDRVFQAYDPVYEGRNGEILYNGLSQPESLNGADMFVFNLLMHRQMGALNTIGVRVMAKELTEDHKGLFREHYRAIFLDTPGGMKWFRENFELVRIGLEALELDKLVKADE
jgi:hypothetical protein